MTKKYFITNDDATAVDSDYICDIYSIFLILLCVMAIIIFICNHFFNYNINLMIILILIIITLLYKYI